MAKRLSIVRRPQLDRRRAVAATRELAADQAHIVGRRQLASRGVPRWVIRAELKAQRWRSTGRQTIAVHRGPLDGPARRWVAVLEVGSRAALDGVSALQEAGVHSLSDERVHVIVPKGSTPQHPPGVRVHESRRYDESAVLSNGIRRVRPAVAAVHAALWARTDRQATYFLILAVQEGLARPVDLHDALATVRRHRRRRLLLATVSDLAGGIRSLGELDVATDFRRRGLPEPDRQVVRKRPSGTEYLDCVFAAYELTLEIDGAGHEDALQQLADLLRDIHSAVTGKVVVRIPLLAYRLGRDQVIDSVAELLRVRGWRSDEVA